MCLMMLGSVIYLVRCSAQWAAGRASAMRGRRGVVEVDLAWSCRGVVEVAVLKFKFVSINLHRKSFVSPGDLTAFRPGIGGGGGAFIIGGGGGGKGAAADGVSSFLIALISSTSVSV